MTYPRCASCASRSANRGAFASSPRWLTWTTVDLRSDTVTRPSPGMRKAMHDAELGDDVFGDDPTVNRLQARAAEIFGFEDALLFPSGTQSNLAALMGHCQRGDEVILGMEAHSYRYEAGGVSVLGSIHPQAIPNRPDGTLDLAEVEAAIKPDDPHFPRTRLLALENTITGRVLGRGNTSPKRVDLAKRKNLSLHLDGARIFNAATALNMKVKDLAQASIRCRHACRKDSARPPARSSSARKTSYKGREGRERSSAAACGRRA